MKAWHSTDDHRYNEETKMGTQMITDGKSAISLQLSTFRKTRLCKTIAFILIFAFILYDITWAQGGTPIWNQAKPNIKLNGKPGLNGINIPYSAGKIDEAYSHNGIASSPSAPRNDTEEIIINIQDAHASLTAQYSIVEILDTLATNYDLNLIALEGAEGPIDTSLLKTFPDPEIRKETAEYLLRKGKMSAGEFFSIISEKPIKLYGIEDDSLYRQNVEAFNKVMDKKLECVKNIDAILKTLNAFNRRSSSSALLTLFLKRFKSLYW
jgi:hypothetical protein